MHARARMRLLGSFIVATSVATAMSLAPLPASAQGDVARAAVLAREAETLLSSGKTSEACGKYAESLELDRRGTTALDLAVCREKQGWLGQAYRAYGIAAELAKKEKRPDREKTAKSARTKLFFKLPKLTVKPPAKVPDGFTITVNGEELPSTKYGKSWESDPTDVVIVASAPGHTPWESKIKLKERQTKTVSVPALKPGADPTPKPVAPPPPTQPGAPVPPPAPVPEEPPAEAREDDEGGRLVVEVGAMGGVLIHTIDRANVTELNGVDYLYRTNNGDTIGTCGNLLRPPGAGECDALFNTEAGAMVGGELFVGWAVIPRLHIGARGFGAKRFKEGWMFVGGPALSVRAVGPIWLGASFLIGGTEHDADIVGAEGSVPVDVQPRNDGQTQVTIPLEEGAPTQADVPSGILLGGSLELSIAIVGPSPNAAVTTGLPADFLAGSLMFGLWPTLLAGENGFAISIPGGFAYRFH